MRKNLITILAVLSFFLGYSQTSINIKWGSEIKADKGTSLNGIIGQDDEGFFVFGYVKGKPTLFKYSGSDMTLIFSKEMEIKEVNGKKTVIEDVYMIGDQIILFTSFYDKTQKTTTAYAQLVSKDGIVNLDAVTLGEINALNRKNTGAFDFVISDDEKSFLIYENPPFEKYSNEKFGFKVLDNKLNLLWEKKLELPYRDKFFVISDYFLDSNNDVYMLATIHPDRSKGEKKDKTQPLGTKTIISYSSNNNSFKEFELKLDKGKFITDLGYIIVDDELRICGFYSDDIRRHSAVGIFYLTINTETKKIISTSTMPFSKETIAEFIGEKQADKGKGLSSFRIRQIISKQEGGVVFTAEQYYVVIRTVTDPKTGATRTTYHYYYNDIFVVDVDKQGVIEWTKRIPKIQHTVNDGGFYSSYLFGISKEDFVFVFNDNPKNIAIAEVDPNIPRKKLKQMVNFRQSVAVYATVDFEGGMRRKPLFKNKDVGTILRPKFSTQLSENEIIVYGIKGKNYTFGKLSFDN